MAKYIPNSILQLDLDYIDAVCNKATFCSQQPTTYAEANATYALADVALAGGDITIGDHDPDGRELVVAAKNGIEVDATGTANHIALIDTVGEELLAVTTCTSQALTLGLFFNMPSFKIIIRDPI
jgi:hypothetical protein